MNILLAALAGFQQSYSSVASSTIENDPPLFPVPAVLASNTATYSCSSSSVVSYGGWAIAYANSNSVSIIQAANACSKAVANAFTMASANCSNTEITHFVNVAASACAQATLEVRSNTLAQAYSTSRGLAIARACGSSSAYAGAMAKAIAKSTASAFATNGQNCSAYTVRACC